MLEIIPLILSVFFNLVLGLVVLSKNSKSATSRAFFATTVCFAAYSGINYISLHPFVFSQLTWIRLDLLSAIPLFLSVYLTFNVFPNHKFEPPNRLRRFLVIYSILVVPLVMTPFVFSRLDVTASGVQPVPAPGIALFALQQVGLLLAALITVFKRFRNSQGRVRAQYKYILLGIALTLSFIIIFNLIFVQVLKITALVPLGSFSAVFFTASFSYAIVKHRLLNIRAIVARSVAYVLLLLALALLYALSVYGVSSLLFAGNGVAGAQIISNVILALALAFTFQPLRRFFERLTDRVFYRDRYDTQLVLNTIGKTLSSELLLGRLLDNVIKQLCESLHISVGQFMIFDKAGKVLKVSHFGLLPHKLMVAPVAAKLRQDMLVADELEGERKEIMEEQRIRVSAMLRTRDEFVGFLFLGDKLSGDIYSSQDLGLLQILSSELAVAITNAKAYEEIAQFNVTLQDRVNQATARLQVANHNLKELDKAKDEFISMASHQLRTPLTTIKGYLSMILEGDAGKVSNEQKEFMNYAFDGAERMVGLISDLLNVSRLSAGRFIIERSACDLAAVVADEVRQLQSHATSKNLQLKFKPPAPKLPTVQLDEGKTRQVIMNFIDNAIYYTKAGSVDVSLTADKANVYLKVRDTGIGVPEAAKKKLFTKFYRAGNAQVARPDGTGLGLYLAKRVVEDQAGTILFESTEGKGSTFGFSLPLKPAGTKS